MCAQFQMEINAKKLAEILDALIPEGTDLPPGRCLPYKKGNVIVQNNQHREIQAMNFSLVPYWSKANKVKFATHNARLFSFNEKTRKEIPIFEKPTWKKPFLSQHCLVPMTKFVEPIYVGKYAGNMVSFHGKNREVICASGIWDRWVSRETGEIVDSFAILTDDPIPFVKKVGHDRSPVFIDKSAYDEWLMGSKKEPDDWISFLRSKAVSLDLSVTIDRPLAKGWEKRIPT